MIDDTKLIQHITEIVDACEKDHREKLTKYLTGGEHTDAMYAEVCEAYGRWVEMSCLLDDIMDGEFGEYE